MIASLLIIVEREYITLQWIKYKNKFLLELGIIYFFWYCVILSDY